MIILYNNNITVITIFVTWKNNYQCVKYSLNFRSGKSFERSGKGWGKFWNFIFALHREP